MKCHQNWFVVLFSTTRHPLMKQVWQITNNKGVNWTEDEKRKFANENYPRKSYSLDDSSIVCDGRVCVCELAGCYRQPFVIYLMLQFVKNVGHKLQSMVLYAIAFHIPLTCTLTHTHTHSHREIFVNSIFIRIIYGCFHSNVITAKTYTIHETRTAYTAHNVRSHEHAQMRSIATGTIHCEIKFGCKYLSRCNSDIEYQSIGCPLLK